MKFKISVPDIQYAMRLVQGVSPKSGPLASSGGVLIRAEEGVGSFTAFNEELAAKAFVKIDQKDEDPGDIVLDAQALYSAISHFEAVKPGGEEGTSDILLSTATKTRKLSLSTKTTYSSGASVPHRRSFALKEKDFFPNIPTVNHDTATVVLPASILMRGFDSVSYALSSDKTRLIFTVVLLHLEDDKLTLFATDGICLSEFTAPVKYEGEPIHILVPGTFAAKVCRGFFDDDQLAVLLTRNMLFVGTPNLTLGGRLIAEIYPDYKAALPTPSAFACFDKYTLLDNLTNLTYEASSVEDARVSVHLSNGEASLVCGHSSNSGIPVDFDGEVEFHANLNYLINSIRNIVGERVKVGLSGPTSLLSFSSEEPFVTQELNSYLVPLINR